MVILGLDPGTTRIGFGLIKKEKGRLIHLKSGLLKIPLFPKNKKLVFLEKSLEALLKKTNPNRIGIEKIFFTKNQKTGIAVAEARGVLLNTVLKKSIPLVELSPSEIKLSVAGHGRANKKALSKMVSHFLKIPTHHLIDDASDALAIAIAASTLKWG